MSWERLGGGSQVASFSSDDLLVFFTLYTNQMKMARIIVGWRWKANRSTISPRGYGWANAR
jgi:hypothetical protein